MKKKLPNRKFMKATQYRQTVAGLAAIDAQLAAMGNDRNGIDSLIAQLARRLDYRK